MTHTDRKLQVGQVVHGDLAALDTIDGDAMAVFCWSDVRPLSGPGAFLDWRLSGAVSRTVEGSFFDGRRSEVMLLVARGRARTWRVFVFGLGPSEDANPTALRHVCRQAYETMTRAGAKKLVFAAPGARRRADLEGTFLRAVSDELPGRVDVILVEHAA